MPAYGSMNSSSLGPALFSRDVGGVASRNPILTTPIGSGATVRPFISHVGPAEPAPIPPASGRHFVIAAGHQLAAEAGAEIFERTGNLFDAAAAATLVLSVVEPHLF